MRRCSAPCSSSPSIWSRATSRRWPPALSWRRCRSRSAWSRRSPDGSVMPPAPAAGLIVVAGAAGVPRRVAGLALAGAGFGAFTPANNAAVMGAAPDGRAGVVGGTLNLVRALGTALGIAVTSLLYATGGATAARALAIPLTGWAVAMGVTGLWLLRRRAHDGVGRRARIGGAA